VDAELAAITNGPTDQTPDDIGLVDFARHDSLREDKGGGTRVVRDHPHGKRIGRCAQRLDLLHQGTEKSVSQSDGAPLSRQVPFEPAQSREIVLGGDQVLGYGC